ncbi:MAG: LPXTG cell wall anchor domain-containing protein [Cyclobacteriaceae bacterium]|nr:LPXTG cell wall anchor domain-containing protein [Cyclobacteriaceae bacterium]
MHAANQFTSGNLLALIVGLIIVVVVSYLLFRKRR